jgi:hypothetical protein
MVLIECFYFRSDPVLFTWEDELKRFCSQRGLVKPVIILNSEKNLWTCSITVGNFVAESGPEKFSADARGMAAQNWLNAHCGKFNSAQRVSDCESDKTDSGQTCETISRLKEAKRQQTISQDIVSDEEKEEDLAINISDEEKEDLAIIGSDEEKEEDAINVSDEEKEEDLAFIGSDEEKEEDLQKKKEAKSTLAFTDLQRPELISPLLTPQMPASDGYSSPEFELRRQRREEEARQEKEEVRLEKLMRDQEER